MEIILVFVLVWVSWLVGYAYREGNGERALCGKCVAIEARCDQILWVVCDKCGKYIYNSSDK